jgi:hypothetical protein
MRQRRARSRPHPRVARPTPSPRHQGWATVAPPPNNALSPISSPQWENLEDGSLFHETYCNPSSSLLRDREDPGALLSTLPERGIPAGGLLHHHGRLRSDVWVVYLGLWVHSSS